MLRSLILRFSDYTEEDTIREHRSVIESHGAVWWGWWKKQHEPSRTSELAHLANRLPLRIGLVDRMRGEQQPRCFVATSDKIVFTQGATPQATPERDLTPSYYRDVKHPAWFRFTAIEGLDVAAFEREFGGVPEGDPTLYVVEGAAAKPEITPVVDAEPSHVVKLRGETILHISDLHFSEVDYGFVPARVEDPTVREPLDRIIAGYISALGPGRDVGLVVVSGDLVSKGDANYYVGVEELLLALAGELRLEREHFVIVPGNHDHWLKDAERPTAAFDHERAFRNFLKVFYEGSVDKLEATMSFRTPKGWEYRCVALNSARPRKQDTKDYGYVGADRYRPQLEALTDLNGGATSTKALYEQRVMNVAVLHHHLLAPPFPALPERDRPVSLTLDAGALVGDLHAANVHLALHGHQHIPFVGSTRMAHQRDREWVWPESYLHVIACGGTGVHRERLWEEMPFNSFGLYTPGKDGLDVQVLEFNQSVEPRSHMDIALAW